MQLESIFCLQFSLVAKLSFAAPLSDLATYLLFYRSLTKIRGKRLKREVIGRSTNCTGQTNRCSLLLGHMSHITFLCVLERDDQSCLAVPAAVQIL